MENTTSKKKCYMLWIAYQYEVSFATVLSAEKATNIVSKLEKQVSFNLHVNFAVFNTVPM